MYSRIRILAVVGFCGSSLALAQISINTQLSVTPKPGELGIRLVVTNQGQEEARDLQFSFRNGRGVTLPRRNVLAPGARHEVTASMATQGQSPGRHPLFVVIGYTDRNGYQFSAVQCTTFAIGQDTSADIFGILKTQALAEKAPAVLQLKNLASEERRFKVRIFTPRELSAQGPEKETRLDAGEEKELQIMLRNFSALPGSHYPLYAVVEYEEAGLHFTNVIPASVDIVSPPGFVTRYQWWILGAAGISLAVVISIWLVRSRRKQHPMT